MYFKKLLFVYLAQKLIKPNLLKKIFIYLFDKINIHLAINVYAVVYRD